MGTISLSDALAATSKGRPSRVDVVLSQLDKADAATLRAALADPHMPARRLERALKRLDPPVTLSDTAIAKWRDDRDVGKASDAG